MNSSEILRFLDQEGIIYEEGSPEEIFDRPKKDKTRQFIGRLQVFETSIRKTGFDPIEQFSGIEQFGFRHMISRRLINKMMIVAEELCIQTILPMLGISDEIRLVFEYSETDGGNVNIEVTYPGQDENPLEKSDDFSLMLIRHACQTLSWECHDGVCRIEGKLVHS